MWVFCLYLFCVGFSGFHLCWTFDLNLRDFSVVLFFFFWDSHYTHLFTILGYSSLLLSVFILFASWLEGFCYYVLKFRAFMSSPLLSPLEAFLTCYSVCMASIYFWLFLEFLPLCLPCSSILTCHFICHRHLHFLPGLLYAPTIAQTCPVSENCDLSF